MIAIIRLLRPTHWLKNGFVFAGVLFGHPNGLQVLAAGILFVAFCAAASTIYIFNDIADIETDKLHYLKAKRPIVSGQVSQSEARIVMMITMGLALGLAAKVNWVAVTIVTSYLMINWGYSIGLKRIVILDVFLIAAGFMLRIIAGTAAIRIPPSQWLLLTGLMLTLFLGFCKRQAEGRAPYTQPMLGYCINVTAAGVIMSYALYTVAPETVAYHHSQALFYTVPFVIYGILRYMVLTGDDAARHLLTDWHLMTAGGLWLATVMAVIWS